MMSPGHSLQVKATSSLRLPRLQSHLGGALDSLTTGLRSNYLLKREFMAARSQTLGSGFSPWAHRRDASPLVA